MTIPIPEFEVVEEVTYDRAVSDPQLGTMLRGFRWQDAVRLFHLAWRNMTSTERDSLESDFNTYRDITSFSYTPTAFGISALNVRFLDPELDIQWSGGSDSGYAGRVTLVEQLIGGI